jgi:hypothetical protein
MKSTVLYALAILNSVLLCTFVARLIPANTAEAQQVPRPGEYLMVPGEVTGGSAGVVYVIDQTRQELSAIAYDDNRRTMEAMPRIQLARVFQTGGR